MTIVVVAMAAVFERNPGVYKQPAAVRPMMSDRVMPLTYEKGRSVADMSLNSIMRGTTGDWMYSAL
jgi:hypothetical protein